MKRGVAGGWIHRRPETEPVLTRAKFELLEKSQAVLVAGREARTRDRGLTFDERLQFAAIESENLK